MAGVLVVAVKNLRAFFERDESSGREHAHLAHAAAKHLANDTAPLDEFS